MSIRSSRRPVRHLVCLLAACVTGACAGPARHPALRATAYLQTAAEARALARTVYASAAARLPAAVADTATSAIPGDGPAGARAPAVVLDLDETVLDNTPWQVRAIRDGTDYPVGWEAWCRQARARAVPGALGFARAAADLGVELFYVSNRDAALEAATRRNLRALGFPLGVARDTVLLKGERDAWTSDKSTRRAWVAREFRIVMSIGDDLGDFLAVDGLGLAQRARAVDEHAALWGARWFVLPNPVYGSWHRALLATGDGESPEAVLAALDAARP